MSSSPVKITVCCMTRFSCIASRRMAARFLRDDRGAVLVEATLILPMVLLLMLGVVEFGRIYQGHHVIEKGLRDAARFLAHVAASCPGGTITNAADAATAKNLALTGQPSGGSPRLPYWTDPGTVTVAVSCLDNSGAALAGPSFIPTINVSASVPYADAGFLSILGVDPLTLTASHQEVNFGE